MLEFVVQVKFCKEVDYRWPASLPVTLRYTSTRQTPGCWHTSQVGVFGIPSAVAPPRSSSQLVTVASFTYTDGKVTSTAAASAPKTTVQSGRCSAEARLVVCSTPPSRARGKEKA